MNKTLVSFYDGLRSLTNALINRRQATSTNRFIATRLDDEQLRAMFISGVASKIYRIKSSYALNNTLQFDKDEDEEFYNEKLKRAVKKASLFQLGFGRGIIVINERGRDLSRPLSSNIDFNNVKLDVFSGDMVSSIDVSLDLSNARYYQPRTYIIKGHSFHYSRVIDFKYIEPAEYDQSEFYYGGVSLAQLIFDQLTNDAIVQRSIPTIVERSSSFFYKMKGFKNRLQNKKEQEVVQYVATAEDSRGIYGAGIIDSEDEVSVITQQLAGLKEIDDLSLRRLALVTGIPVPMLVGENVKGLNSAGDTERDVFNDNNEEYQEDYLIDNIRALCKIFGIEGVRFKESGDLNANEKVEYETRVINNAILLDNLGEDGILYLKDKGVIVDSEESGTYQAWSFDEDN